ncbi:hypothetical protein [Papillibacter cinnamivorans]|uniref:DivIVA protein n=1 Tax=Papillibacter cinnamivorans DSM 12816 TaxID=1122930 RepID=A0A1W1Z2C9_9FIRM|nr:hypothetical protein [Papillibacter cinnamivorans]SMC42610.1 hypothetical protein SAMN02745168_0889 [Papillibacter cinnamivorans DSM 12816]
MENKLFKSSAFGGFNRQDVLNYIENASRESAEIIEKNRRELDAFQARVTEQEDRHKAELENLQTEIMQLRADLQVAGDENERLTSQKDGLAAQLEEICQENSRLTAVTSRQSEELDGMSAELDELRGKLSKTEPDAVAYETMKLHMAEIEVSAYQRAEAIEKAARDQAAKLRKEMEALLSRARERYASVQAEFEVVASHISGELGKMQDSLGSLSAELDGLGSEFGSLHLPDEEVEAEEAPSDPCLS